jgi:WD40 repeat protein/energy-coupling factor transporter ATP-binding protein EcfA2
MRASWSNPFPGLRPFEFQEKHLFFGREEQVVELLSRLRRGRFLAVVGPSGSGKSSLVRAGLLPELHGGSMVQAGSHWEILVMRPGGDPLGHLANVLAGTGQYDLEEEDQIPFVKSVLNRSALGLIEAAKLARFTPGTNLLLLVDQFEELFRFGQKGHQNEAAAFVNLLLEAARQSEIPIYVLITMRADFLGDCARFRGLAEAINQGEYLIPRLTRSQMQRAIIGPVCVGGGEMTPRLVQRLLNDAGEDPDQLPVLQHALMRAWGLWEQQGRQGPIDLELYEAIGAMHSALSRHADEIFEELQTPRKQWIAEKIFKELTELGPDNRGIRRPGRLADLQEVIGAKEEELREVIDPFRQSGRTFLMPPAEAPLLPERVLDISHESLMRVWRRLENWTEEEAESARKYRRLAETAQLWKKGQAGLFRDPDLEIALQWKRQNKPGAAWAERYFPGFSAAMEFLEESRKAREAEKQAQAAAQRRELEQARALAESERLRAEKQARLARERLMGVMVLAGLFVLAVSTALWAWHLRSQAVEQRNLAQSRELVAKALRQAEADPEQAIVLALDAVESARQTASDDALSNAEEALRIALLSSHLRTVFPAEAHFARFSPDGSWVVTADEHGQAEVWEAMSGKRLAQLQGHSLAVFHLSFQDHAISTWSFDGTVRQWDGRTGRELQAPRKLPLDLTQAYAAGISPDTRQLVTTQEDARALVWDLENGELVQELIGHALVVNAAAFSPDGKWIATASADDTARIWEKVQGANGEVWRTAAELFHADDVVSVSFSPDSNRLVTSSKDKTSRVWHAPEGKPAGRSLIGHADDLTGACFSPDGRFVLTASQDRTARIWEIQSGREVAILRVHGGSVHRAVFSPDGAQAVTASEDGRVRIWEARTGRVLDHFAEQPVNGAAFSSMGAGVISCGGTTARLVEVFTGRKLAEISSGSEMLSARMSPDNRFALTAHEDGIVRLWDVSSNGMPQELIGHAAPVHAAVFSGNGRWIVSASEDETAQVWDAGILNFSGGLNRHAARHSLPHASRLAGLALSPDDRFLAVVGGNTVRIWRTENWERADPADPVQHEHRTLSASFSGDGRYLATASRDRTVRILRAGDWTELQRLEHAGEVVSVSMHPSSPIVASAWNRADVGTVSLWSWKSGALLAEIRTHAANVTSVEFSPDGNSILTASEDGTVRLFAARECASLAEISELGLKRLAGRSGGMQKLSRK